MFKRTHPTEHGPSKLGWGLTVRIRRRCKSNSSAYKLTQFMRMLLSILPLAILFLLCRSGVGRQQSPGTPQVARSQNQLLEKSPSPVTQSAPSAESSVSSILDTLASDYQSHGLPFPPADAEIVRRRIAGGVVNDVQMFSYHLAFTFKNSEGTKVHWKGCEPSAERHRGVDERVEPTPQALEKTTAVSSGSYWPSRFPTHPDLALAIQCHHRGWSALAEALLERSNRRFPGNVFDKSPLRARDPRKALATLAWNYWCNHFSTEFENRGVVLERLKTLSDGGFGLTTIAHRNLLLDMERTLIMSDVKPGTPEAALEALVDLNNPGYWPGSGHNHFVEDLSANPNFKKLRDMGLDAVPVLIKHLRDFRLTRSIQFTHGGRYTWHVRVADVVGVLLNGLNGGDEEFSYDFLETEGRGKRLDERHVLHWWEKTRGANVVEYLVKNAIVKDESGEWTANANMLHALGKSHPPKLIELVERSIPDIEYTGDLLDALSKSKANAGDKARLYLMAAGRPEWQKRVCAIEHLLDAKHPDGVSLLLEEIKNIPKTPKVKYWHSSADRISGLALHTDDDRAWSALMESARRVDIGQRMQMIQSMGGRYGPDRPQRLKFLIGFLDDAEIRTRPDLKFDSESLYDGPCAGFIFKKLAVRDYAALMIAYLKKLEVTPDATWQEKDWRNLQKQVRDALAKEDSSKEFKQ